MEETQNTRVMLIESPFGILAFDGEGRLMDKVLFAKNAQSVARILVKIEAGKIVDEAAQLVDRLKKRGCETLVLENAGLASKLRETFEVGIEVLKPSKAGEVLRSSLERFAIETGFVRNTEEFRLWMHNLSMEMAKLRVKKAVEKKDLLIAQAIQTLDDLDKTINLFMGRIREWYGIHFPELDRLLDKHETFARLVFELGGKENFAIDKLEEKDIPKSKASQIAGIAETSMGADLTESDLSQIQALCKSILELNKLRGMLEKYLDETMEEVAPNTKAIAGSLLGARLIALAGGLENLAKRPASTIQVLGAEKALFRSLKTGTRPPKHGIVFQHTYLHEAKKWQRGKIARALAGKVAIAARVDAYGGEYIGDQLKADLEKRLKEISEKYAEPPPIVEKKPKHEKKWRKIRRARRG